MSIEKDIHQQRFRNEYEKGVINLMFTHNWIRDQIQTYFASHDLTMQQYNILRILRGAMGQPLSTLQIRERMLDKMSDTSRIVDRLLLKNLVEKSTCKKDKRLVDIIISESGLHLLQSLDVFSENMDNLLSNLSAEETEQLNFLLDKAREKPIKMNEKL